MANQLIDSGSQASGIPVLPSPALTVPSKRNAPFWQSKRFVGLLTMTLLYVIWGTTLSAMHFGIQSIPPATFAFLRYFMVACLLLSFCKLKREAWPSLADIKSHAIAGICLFTVGNATAIWAVKYIPTVLAGALMATTPFWMIALAALQPPKEPLRKSVLVGMLLGFFGIMTILAPQFVQEFSGNAKAVHFGVMEWLSVVGMASTSAFWAIGSLYAKRNPSQNSMLMTVGFQNLAASLAMLPFMLPSLVSGAPLHITQSSFMALLYLVFVGTIIAVPCYYYVLKTLPVSLASTFAYVSPVITMIVGHFFLKEALSPTLAMGACLVLVGVILVQSVQQKVSVAPSTALKSTSVEQKAA